MNRILSTIFLLGLCGGTALTATAKANPASDSPVIDGELYVAGNAPPLPTHQALNGEDSLFENNEAISPKATFYQRDLAKWKDPLTLPHTRTSCVKYASGNWPWGGGWKTCVGWKTETQWLYNTATLTVNAPNAGDIDSAVNQCLATGAVVAAVSAIVTGGDAAVPAFEETMKDCLIAKLGTVSVSVQIHSQWGGWE